MANDESKQPLGASLLATLAYHDLLDLPLTAVQCWRYLLRPRGPADGKASSASGTPGLRDIEQTLEGLVRVGQIDTRHGFYFFPGRGRLVDEWIAKHARSQWKWRRLRRIVRWWPLLPFLRGVAGTGSLAFDNAKVSSDLDVLVVAEQNRVWTVRFLLTVLLDLLRLRRRPLGPTRDRVCLNHYLSLDALEFPYRSLYTAMEYARLVPLLGEDVCRRFRDTNRPWMEGYLDRVFPDVSIHEKTTRTSPWLRALQHALEWPLSGSVGDALERLLARLQQTRITRGEPTRVPGRVVATEARAEFHPHSREAPLLRAFNARMEALGLAAAFGNQEDSGLS